MGDSARRHAGVGFVTELLLEIEELLIGSGFKIQRMETKGREVTIFEDSTVIGFLFVYKSSTDLFANWEKDSDEVIRLCQLGLRRAKRKAWNLYSVFIAEGSIKDADLASLTAIEEDLSGTRKIARAGVTDTIDIREALLALLPLQAAPKLEAIDIVDEIRQRATEQEPRVLSAFFSSSDETTALQVFEDEV